MGTSWSSRVIARLRELKDQGERDFDRAWTMATLAHRPQGRDQGDARPVLFDASLPMMEEPAESMVEFTRRACADAWCGRRPTLQHLSVDLLDVEPVDEPMSRRVA